MRPQAVDADDTIVACLTPPATGAIATLALRGPAAWDITSGLFQSLSRNGKPLPDVPEVGRVWYGRLGTDMADEVVLGVKATHPHPWVEVHCHGGQQVVRLLLDALAERGARVTSWQEFERLITDDPLQSLAASALAEARTMRTAAILLDQYHGAFRKSLTAAVEALERGDAARGSAVIGSLMKYADVGRHLTRPWTVALAGAPNVGKSSLLNALAGYQRSIVAPTPGTTRDVVTALVALDGWPVELADTAGVRDQAGDLEGQGIGRARDAAARADLCLWVLDAGAEPVWPDVPAERVLLVVNKVDLPPAWDGHQAAAAVCASARTGTGIPELCDAIARRLVPQAPSPGEAVPFTPELCDGIGEASAHLSVGRTAEARRALAGILDGTGLAHRAASP
jgi:tRNA modification GTPase